MAALAFVVLLAISSPVQSIANRQYDNELPNRRPIIGILAQETGEKLAKFGESYIAASYVKYIESAGARVVPILHYTIRTNLTGNELEKLFQSINGVLFPGGGVSLTESGYGKNGKAFYDLSLKAFDAGEVFPVWGTCLGFELLSAITSGLNSTNVLTACDAQNLITPLNFADGYAGSRMFDTAPDHVVKYLSGLNVTANFHQYCLLTETFQTSKDLTNFYKLLSTNKDRKGQEFVSTMEGHKYPIFASQWHPEKNPFEWVPWENTSHSFEAVVVAQYMANFFVEQSRQSTHRFPSPDEEEAALIYNYNPVMTAKYSGFEQCYFF